MSMRSFLICALGITAPLTPVAYSSAATVVAAQDYGVQVSYKTLAQPLLKSGVQGTPLQLRIANHGAHDLYDVRIYLHRVGSKLLLDRQEPARLNTLPAGASNTIQWTYDSRRDASDTLSARELGKLRDVVYRIEAVDKSTQQIIKIYQKGTEAG